ncbi:MAG: PQQ-binding-like beta-propeller repeat protein [Gammaproteobacteria bacterium]|nr:PQQ-binding-like beta-propeller repeat protein [Gammaproteobacteria bacterium]
MRKAGLLLCLMLAAAGVRAETKPEGAALFDEHCARCHDRDLPRIPTRETLKQRDPKDVFTAISAGIMAPYGRGLDSAQRRAVAEYASGQPLGDFASGAAAIPKTAYCPAKPAPLAAPDAGWNGWGVDAANSRFIDATRAGLAAGDVPKLRVKWAFGVPAVTTMSGQPVAVGGRVYFGTFSGLVIALDADTGCTHWVFEAHAGIRTAVTLGKLPDGTTSLFFGDLSGKVYALDPDTGREHWSSVADDHLHARVTGTPMYHAGRLYVPLSSLEEVAGAMPDYECCTFRGAIAALDATTGKQIWKTHTIAEAPTRRGRNPAGAQLWAPSGAAVWSAPTLDPEHDALYLATGDSYSDPAAPESDAVMSLAMSTGKVRWIRQATHGDAYTTACADPSPKSQVACPKSKGPDLDFGASPVLAKDANGRSVLLAGQKSGVLHALEPATGSVLWQKTVGRGGIVGGIEWGFAVADGRAYVALAEAWEHGPNDAGGIVAVDLRVGATVWQVGPAQGTCEGRKRCNTGQLAAVSGMPGVVFSGALDGHLRAYSTQDGSVLWDVDTRRDYATVNAIAARGGSLNGPGPAIADGRVFLVSGYALWNLWTPGNVLLAFTVEGH